MSVEYSTAASDGSPSSSDLTYALSPSPSPWLVDESMAADAGTAFDWPSLSPSSSSFSWHHSALSISSPVVGGCEPHQLCDDELQREPSLSSSPSPPEQDWSQPAEEGDAGSAARPRFWSRKVACQVCHYSKARCDGSRPCERCVRLRHTADCVDRPSKRRAESSQQRQPQSDQQQQLLPPSLPATRPPLPTLPLNEELLSESLLSTHLRWLRRLQGGLLSHLRKKPMDLRDKLTQHAWSRTMMRPEHIEQLAHSFITNHAWYTHFYPPHHSTLISAAVSALTAQASAASRRSNAEPSTGQHRPCDGKLCFGFCPFVEALLASCPCVHSWLRSPSIPIPDQPFVPNHAFLVLRRLGDERSILRRQQLLVDESGLRVARRLLTAGDEQGGGAGDGGAEQPAAVMSLEISMSVQCNGAFERLLEWRQAELREAFVSEGEKAFYRLFRERDWLQLMDMDREARIMRREEMRLYAVCITQRRLELSCLLHCHSQFDADGRLALRYISFLPLPDASTTLSAGLDASAS